MELHTLTLTHTAVTYAMNYTPGGSISLLSVTPAFPLENQLYSVPGLVNSSALEQIWFNVQKAAYVLFSKSTIESLLEKYF